ncbi:hypothetical protein [Methanobacterium sp. SMA-27]|uniref:hypothetical protein n=1 Tax=Methanobacterium sp. SMA-27 TaxID=1495336 RepID=UPI00064F6427|nr:hypothetical protein [Methanobacterium sp. SMA-27]
MNRITLIRSDCLGLNNGDDIIKSYWSLDGPEPWGWEETGKIHVYGLSGVSNNEIEKVIEIITEVINGFSLPLSVKKGNIDKKDDLEQLVKLCSYTDEIDFEYLEKALNRRRKETKFLPYGVVIVVNQSYSFKQSNHEVAIYGISSSNQGLIVIKRKHIGIATKHEFGHMIGINNHHPNCVMQSNCIPPEFCKKCQNKINNIWKYE